MGTHCPCHFERSYREGLLHNIFFEIILSFIISIVELTVQSSGCNAEQVDKKILTMKTWHLICYILSHDIRVNFILTDSPNRQKVNICQTSFLFI